MTEHDKPSSSVDQNAFVAAKLRGVAKMLDLQCAAPFCTRAYHEAAIYVASDPRGLCAKAAARAARAGTGLCAVLCCVKTRSDHAQSLFSMVN